MVERYRQEVFNVLLAQLLQERGVISAPESIVTLESKSGRRMPDVIVNYHGLRIAIEGEVSDRKKASDMALKASRRRVEEGIAHIGVAVVYPEHLREVEFAHLKTNVAQSRLQIAIVTESADKGFVPGDVDYLETALRHAFEQLVQEDIVVKAVAELDAGIEKFARVMVVKKGDVGRVAECLGIRDLPQDNSAGKEEAE